MIRVKIQHIKNSAGVTGYGVVLRSGADSYAMILTDSERQSLIKALQLAARIPTIDVSLS